MGSSVGKGGGGRKGLSKWQDERDGANSVNEYLATCISSDKVSALFDAIHHQRVHDTMRRQLSRYQRLNLKAQGNLLTFRPESITNNNSCGLDTPARDVLLVICCLSFARKTPLWKSVLDFKCDYVLLYAKPTRWIIH